MAAAAPVELSWPRTGSSRTPPAQCVFILLGALGGYFTLRVI